MQPTRIYAGDVDGFAIVLNVDTDGNLGIQQQVNVAGLQLDADDTGLVALATSLKGVPTPVTATIAQNATLSGAVDLGTMKDMGLIMPGVWTAAHITFQVCDTLGGTYAELVDATGTEVNIAVSAGVAYSLATSTQRLLAPWRFIKIQSGATGATVAQTAARNIVIVGK